MLKNKDIILELYQLPERKLKDVRERKDGYIDLVTFDADDIDIYFFAIMNVSFPICEENPVFLPFGSSGCKYFNILSPDGKRLEFNQILK